MRGGRSKALGLGNGRCHVEMEYVVRMDVCNH